MRNDNLVAAAASFMPSISPLYIGPKEPFFYGLGLSTHCASMQSKNCRFLRNTLELKEPFAFFAFLYYFLI
jgi:hypothetical protein